MIGIVQRRLTQAVPLPPGVRVIPCPSDVGRSTKRLWASVHTHDRGHLWFRTLVCDTARLLESGEAAPLRNTGN